MMSRIIIFALIAGVVYLNYTTPKIEDHKALLLEELQLGFALTEDVNGYRQEGFAAFDRNVHRGRRLSAARAYLHPILARRGGRAGRPNSRGRALAEMRWA